MTTDPTDRWFDAEVDEMTLGGLAVLSNLRRALTDQGLGEAVTVLDEHAEAMIAEHTEED